MKRALAIASSALAALVACTGANGSSNAPPSALAIVAPGVTPGAPLVLVDQSFLNPHGDSALLQPSDGSTAVQWSITGDAASLSTQQPFTIGIPGDPVPTAPPGEMYIQGTSIHGKAVVTATDGSQSATLTVLHFGWLDLGCRFRYQPAINFDADNPLTLANATSADLYVTAPAAQLAPLDPCFNSPLATGTTVVWHAPHGATIIPVKSMNDFLAITPQMWKNDGTTFTPAQSSAAILLKTAEGHFAKAVVPSGPLDATSGTSFIQP